MAPIPPKQLTVEEVQLKVNHLHEAYLKSVIDLANQCEETVFLQPLRVKPWQYLSNRTPPSEQPFVIRVERSCELAHPSDFIEFGRTKI